MGLLSSHEIDPKEIVDAYGGILLPGETVLTAFKSIRDTAALTTHRFLLIDVQGLTGSRVSVQSVPYRSIVRFAVESAGTFDFDSDLKIWVVGATAPLSLGVSRNADPQAILRLLAEYTLDRKD